MKTIKNLLFVAFAAMTVAACQKELAGSDQNATPKTIVTFSGDLDQVEADTKTTMWYETGLESGKFTTYFMDADHITVNGYESGNIIKVEGTNGSKFNFEIPFDEGKDVGPYYAATAYHVDEKVNPNYDETTHTYTLLVSSNQSYRLAKSNTVTSFFTGADILAAYGEDLHLSFKHLSTFLAISLEGETEFKDNIKTVYVRQGDGGNIAGRWYLKFDGNNEPYLEPDATNLTNVIIYNCVVSDIADNGVEQGKALIIGVPSYDYPNGLLVTIKDVNGNFASYHIKEANYKSKGGVIIPFKPKFNPGSGVIKTAADWEDFAAAINSGNDSKLYRWVGNGTVKLGANIEADNLTSITTKFPYVFDGCNHSIKRNTADQALFSDLTGEIRNLTLDGELNLTGEGAPFVTNMYAGAKITGCTNNMDVTFALSTHCYVTGFAAIAVRNDTEEPELLEISNCTNNGKIEGTVNVSTANYNTAVAGFIADVRSAVGNFDYDVKLVNCKNTAPITLAPISGTSTTYGMSVCGVAGIIGWCRDIKSLTLNDCDNSGAITVKADYINSVEGLKACVAAAGGIIGVGSNVGSGKISTNGRVYSLINCDNTATIYNCMVNASSSSEGLNKVYTGGLAGALLGKATDFAEVRSCSNTGNVITYDITNDDKSKPASSTHCAVAGGLIGCGGNLTIEDCTVNCHIGNGKRQMVSWGGVIGYTVKPFTVKNATLTLGGYFQRISTYNMNRAVVAVVPASTDDIQIDLTDSKIEGQISVTGCMTIGTKTGCLLTTKEYPGGTDTDNLANRELQTVIYSLSNVKSNLVNGKGTYSVVNTSSADVSYAKAE